MPYYIRVLAESDAVVPVAQLRVRLKKDGVSALLDVEDGSDDDWYSLLLRHEDGAEIALVERNLVHSEELGAEEIAEFLDEVSDLKPKTAARWLETYLPSIETIFAFQLLSGTDVGDGWKAVHATQAELWNCLGGILQADGEGFSNTDGYQIVWQFSDDVSGPWKMAVLDEHGAWISFEMELDNPRHRKAFLAGRVPATAKRLA
jgi:hypothetical protein